jgi:hypothetical protein
MHMLAMYGPSALTTNQVLNALKATAAATWRPSPHAELRQASATSTDNKVNHDTTCAQKTGY